jgi:drug/metabolite transporter (DMT)-like permease
VLGPIWVWLALDERPDTLTLVGGTIVTAAIVLQTREAPSPGGLVSRSRAAA